ncbi:MAG: hypothetical protein Ct9H300mP15_29940 [Gemmatimonadota bacterium]|nr:MAG: hypothetical protein Ct9H300mP15_29940 [Gemmatimonadota bacterium]
MQSRGQSPPLTSEDQPFFVTVLQDGTFFMEETEVTLEELEADSSTYGYRERSAHLYPGDSLAPYGPVLRVWQPL